MYHKYSRLLDAKIPRFFQQKLYVHEQPNDLKSPVSFHKLQHTIRKSCHMLLSSVYIPIQLYVQKYTLKQLYIKAALKMSFVTNFYILLLSAHTQNLS